MRKRFQSCRRVAAPATRMCQPMPRSRQAPKGIELETLDSLKRYAQQIETQAVKNKSMPLGNKTKMLPEERAKLGAWIKAL